jgi:hypothetical protein
MAQCTKCGKRVGCGCNLKNGLCSTCSAEEKKIVKREEETHLGIIQSLTNNVSQMLLNVSG